MKSRKRTFQALDEAAVLIAQAKPDMSRQVFVMPIGPQGPLTNEALYALDAIDAWADKTQRQIATLDQGTPDYQRYQLHLFRLGQGRYALSEALNFALSCEEEKE